MLGSRLTPARSRRPVATSTSIALLSVLALRTPPAKGQEASAYADHGKLRLELDLRAGLVSSSESVGLRLGQSASGAVSLRLGTTSSVGLVAERYHYGWDARTETFHDPNASVDATAVALATRIYFQDEGTWDPYFQLALGRTFVSASVSSDRCTGGDGILLQLGMGWDTYVARWLKLGPMLAVSMGGSMYQACNDIYYVAPEPPEEPSGVTGVALRVGGAFVLPR